MEIEFLLTLHKYTFDINTDRSSFVSLPVSLSLSLSISFYCPVCWILLNWIQWWRANDATSFRLGQLTLTIIFYYPHHSSRLQCLSFIRFSLYFRSTNVVVVGVFFSPLSFPFLLNYRIFLLLSTVFKSLDCAFYWTYYMRGHLF